MNMRKTTGFVLLLLILLCNLGGHGLVQAEDQEAVTTSSGLQYVDLVKGDGRVASVGETAIVHYTGWLKDGTKFDSR